jgi:PhzF family phenazine biosynthesis protein
MNNFNQGRNTAMEMIQVDSFTAVPFAGNPAAVCLLDGPRPESWMQDVAREMNLSETAFLHRENGDYRLRWFSPATEIALCGHATLASAHVLWENGVLDRKQQARFHTMSGLLTADADEDWIRLDFPVRAATATEPPAGLLESLGIHDPVFVGKNVFDYIVEVASGDAVRSVNPDMGQLATVEARGVMVTARGDGEFDFISRFFAPKAGVPEDPVTGSAHCCLTPYWAEKLGKTEMLAYQASARGGVIKVALRGDRVWLSGQAVTVLRGELVAD